MAYCEVSDIQKYYLGGKKKFTATSDNMDESQILEFINNKSSEIDSFLSDKYDLPITGTNSLLLLKNICEKLVVCDVDGVLQSDTVDQGTPYKKSRADKYCEQAYKILKKLQDGDMLLTDEESEDSVIGYSEGESIDCEASICDTTPIDCEENEEF